MLTLLDAQDFNWHDVDEKHSLQVLMFNYLKTRHCVIATNM